MKAFAFALLVLAAGSVPAFAQTTLARWTFETSVPSTSGPVSPEVGAGVASGFHTGAATYSSPAGNGSAHSFSANTWAIGDYFQFKVDTTGFTGISLAWDQTSSGTGPKDFKLSYSTDGTNFTQFTTYSVLANSAPNPVWNGTTSSSLYSFSNDLSSVLTLNNTATVYFRLIDTSTNSAGGGTVGTGGTDRVDNFTVTAVPEPSTYALFAGLSVLAVAFVSRRRQVLVA